MNDNWDFFRKVKRQIYKLLPKAICLSILVFSALLIICPTLTNAQPTNTGSSESQIQSRLKSELQSLDFSNNTIYMGMWVLHIYSFQYTTGTYTVDMYVYFFWTNPNITTVNWYLTNGYPINDAAKVIVNSDTTGPVKYQFYRITASMNTPPDARDYPFDEINLKISTEVLNVSGANLAWLENQTGVDPAFVNPNWKTTNIELSVVKHDYPLGIQAPYAEMIITQAKLKPSSALSSLFPPIIFCFVSAISFLFGLKDPPSVGLRMGLNTSMLITTILFQLSISGFIPPSTSISTFGLFSISVLVFLAMNLVVTIIGFAHFVKYKDVNFTLKINRWGFVISIILPIVLYIVLSLLRA
jgi:hypothetical protein